MSAFLHDVARASFPVAIVLLILTAFARGVLWLPAEDDRVLRFARQYLEPLSTWCLIALATHTVALCAAGEAGVVAILVPAVLGACATLLRPDDAEDEEPASEAPRAAAAAPAPPRAHAPNGSLWARPAAERSREIPRNF